ncbi:hypothetical protein [Actinoplanes sp. NPDC026623]|uniref:hypothetical protein n=1 Tax=Actinoplanes sp. NPDC026623 TaxID=3155610 RepID=UPI00340810CF
MSLSVYVFVFGRDGEWTLLDAPSMGAELAGFESFRVTVWGSDAVRALGARFFPMLASGDLTVAPEDVAAFLGECAVLRANLDAIAPQTGPQHSHEWYSDTVSDRLANVEAAAQRALEVGGGVLIW